MEIKYKVTPKEMKSVWRMMIRSGDFSFSADRLNNLVDTLVKLGEIRPDVAAEARTIAAYGGEIMQGRAMTERNIDLDKKKSYGEQIDQRYYTGKGLSSIRAAETAMPPARRMLRFTPDIDPKALRILSQSLGSNEGSRLFRLVRNNAIAEGVIPPTKVTRGSVRAEIKAMRRGREAEEPKLKGRSIRSIIAKQRAEEARLGATGGRPAYDTQTRRFNKGSVDVSTVETGFEGSGRGLPLVSEALAAAGGESPEVKFRRSQAKAIQRLSRLARTPVPLEGGRAMTQKDDPSEERAAVRSALIQQQPLRDALVEEPLDPEQERRIREELNPPKGSSTQRSIDKGVRKTNKLVDRILSAGKGVRERLRKLALSNSPEFKKELQRLVRAYQADVALRKRETEKAEFIERRYGRRTRGFRQAREGEVQLAPRRPQQQEEPVAAETMRRWGERGRGKQAVQEEARRVGVSELRRLGRVREVPGRKPVLKAAMSPRILEQPVQLPAARPAVSMSEAGIPVPRTQPDRVGLDVEGLIEFMRNRANTLKDYSPEESQRFMMMVDALERNMAERAAKVAPLEAERLARIAAQAQRVPEVKPASRPRSLMHGTNPVAVLRALAAWRNR